MPLPPSRMIREEGEAGEIPDAPPPRREPLPSQRYSTTVSAGSYASLALDPPSHLQRMSSNASDDSRRGGGRSFAPIRGGRGREPGRFGARYSSTNNGGGGREESQHLPPPMRPRTDNNSGEFSTGAPTHRGAPVIARGRGFPPGGRFPPRGGGRATGRWVGGRDRMIEQDVHEPAVSTFSLGAPAPAMRGGRGPFVPRGGVMDGRGRVSMPRGGGIDGRGRPLPPRGRGMDGRGGHLVPRGSFEGRGPPQHMSHRPPPDPESFTKRTYSDLVNDPPQLSNIPDQKRIRANPSFGSEGEIMPPKHGPSFPSSTYRDPSYQMPPASSSAENFESFPERSRPPMQDGAPPRPHSNFPPGSSMHASSQPTFRQPGRGGPPPPDRSMNDGHSMDRPGFIRGPPMNHRPVYNAGFSGPGNVDSSFEDRTPNYPLDRSKHLGSPMGRSEGVPRGLPPPETDLGPPPGPPRDPTVPTSWRAMNNNVGGLVQGGVPPESQGQYPPHPGMHRPLSEAGRGGYIRGGPGRGVFPGRGDGRGRAMRAQEILAGRGGDILGGRGPPAPPPLSTYDDYGSRPPIEYGGGRGGRGGGRMTMRPPQTSQYNAVGWSSRPLPRTEVPSNDAKTNSPPPPAPIPPPESPKPEEPEPVEPSGYVTALVRLADLQAQMEFEFAKHMRFLNKHQELKAQFQVLENLPVGLDAIKDDLSKLENKASA